MDWKDWDKIFGLILLVSVNIFLVAFAIYVYNH